MERLSAADMSSLQAERGPVHMHVGAVMVFNARPSRAGGKLDYDSVVRTFERRLHLIPRYRDKLSESRLNLANPSWVDDEDFDISYHVWRAALPAPGGDRELNEFVGRFMSERLDRARPLWEVCVLEGLAQGRRALVAKMHHALVDGVGAVDVGTLLLDPSPQGQPIPRPHRKRAAAPRSGLARVADDALALPVGLARAAADRARDPRGTVDELREAAEVVSEIARGRPQAPRTSLDAGISPHRRFAMARGRLHTVKLIKNRFDATVNDVMLAAVCGMLRERFEARREKVPEQLVALVPVNVRTRAQKGELGNHISMLFVDLPTGEPDPVARLRAIHATTEELKASAQVRAGEMIAEATGWVPPPFSALVQRAMGSPHVFNLVVSNVPGPQVPFYLNGVRLREIFPVVPLNPRTHALAVGALSYDGGVYFGLDSDRDIVPDLDQASSGLERALAELARARPGARRAQPKRSTSRSAARRA